MKTYSILSSIQSLSRDIEKDSKGDKTVRDELVLRGASRRRVIPGRVGITPPGYMTGKGRPGWSLNSGQVTGEAAAI
jgi:hypothetical protein